MVSRGEVALADPPAKFLPKTVKVLERDEKQTTLQDLATHKSALPRLPTNLMPKDPTNPYVDYTVENLYTFLNSLHSSARHRSAGGVLQPRHGPVWQGSRAPNWHVRSAPSGAHPQCARHNLHVDQADSCLACAARSRPRRQRRSGAQLGPADLGRGRSHSLFGRWHA